MIPVEYIVLIAFLLCVALHCKLRDLDLEKRNRLGAVMIFLVAIIAVILPIYILILESLIHEEKPVFGNWEAGPSSAI